MQRTAGTHTLLFTDIEGSTQHLLRLGDSYPEAIADHHRIVRAVIAAHEGHEVHTAGDGFFALFSGAADAVHAATARGAHRAA